MFKNGMAALALVSLGGCATVTDAQIQAQRPPTPSEKAAIVADLKDRLFDRYSARDVQITSMVTRSDGSVSGCVFLNSKNRMGGYTGLSGTAYVLKDSKVVNVIDTGQVAASKQFVHGGCFDERRKTFPLPGVGDQG